MVPAMVSRRVGLSQREASGNSLAAILPIAVVGTVTYSVSRSVDAVAALSVIPGSIAGAIAGARLTPHVPERVLALLFAGLSLAVAVRLAIPFGLPTTGHAATASAVEVVALVALGLVAGLASGLLGIGGGVIIIPVLVIGFGLSQHLAQGTSLAAIVPTGLSGAVTHHRLGHLHRRIVVALTAGGVAGAVGGSLVANHIPTVPLRSLFAAYVAITGIYVGRRRLPVASGGSDSLP